MVKPDPAWNKDEIEKRMKEYFVEHSRLTTDPRARHPQHTHIHKNGREWRVEQVMVDPLGRNDWQIVFNVEIPEDPEAALVFALEAISPI